jgi:microcystin-dependent protein
MAIVLDGTTGVTTPAIDAGNMVGEVCFFAMSTAPSGFLKANGAAVSRTTYAALFTAIGTTFGAGDGSTTFLLPDLRGEFARGWDDGRAVDSGRAFGSAQADALQNITGTIYGSTVGSHGGQSSGAFTTTSAGSTFRDALEAASGSQFVFNANNVARTATETRARNVALLACIKF